LRDENPKQSNGLKRKKGNKEEEKGK